MYRDFKRYIATEKDRRAFRYWMLGCTIVYGLPLLHFVGVLAFTHYASVSHRGAGPASIALTVDPRPAITP
jgi:NO-binding membrane sensor protein with MHYT domain